jgi:hypothetical protein
VELHDLAAIESPDVGDELAQRIAQESMVVRQRLLIQPPLDAASVEEAASDRAYYGEIAQRNDAIEREVEGMVNGQSSLMAKLGIPDHSGPNFSDAISLDNLLDQLRQQVDPWELARSAVRTMFFGELHNLIELGRIRGETGKEVVQRLRKQIIDRHEAVHLLDEWDPKQTLYREFYARLGDSETLYMSALRFYLFHGEVNAIIGELRYGDPLMALDRLLAFTAPESAQLRARIANVDEHYRARLWVRQALLYFLDHGWGERFGMRFVPGINRADQIKVQLFRLSRPDCRPILNDLAEALQAKHDQAHLDPEAMLRQPTSRTWSWGCSMGLGAALVALAVWFIRRRSAHRQSGRPTM